MKTEFLLQILIFAYLTQRHSGAKLMKACSEDNDCPPRSSCRIRGCDGRICICNDGHMPSEDYETCLKIAELGSSCGNSRNARCRGLSSRCNETNICECHSGYIRSLDGKYCKLKPVLRTSYSLLGEECDGDRKRCIDVNTVCENSVDNSVCVCRKGFRNSTNNEINAFPFNIVQCVPVEFGLDITVQPSNCFTPFEILPSETSSSSSTKTSWNTEISLSSKSSLLSISPVMSSVQTAKMTSIISSESFRSLMTEMSTQLSTSFQNILSAMETDVAVSALSVLQTSSPNVKNTLSTIATNLPTDALIQTNTVNTMQTKGDISFINPLPTVEFQSSKTSTFLPTTLEVSNLVSEDVFSHFELESSFLGQAGKKTLMTTITEQSAHPFSAFSTTKTDKNSFATLPKITQFQTSSNDHQTTYLESSFSKEDRETITFATPQIYSGVKQTATLRLTEPVSTNSIINEYSSTSVYQNYGSQSVSPVPSTHFVSPSSTAAINTATKTNGQPTTFTSATSITPRTVTIQHNCSTTLNCPANSHCEVDACGESRCRCNIEYADNSKSTKCLKVARLREKCDHNSICIDRYSQCSSNKCVCSDGYEVSSDGNWCRKQESWFISFPLLGEECGGFFADCFHQNEQICSEGTCQCKNGLRNKSMDDIMANFKTTMQCLNESFVYGYRQPAVCRGQVRYFETDSNEEEAERKIRIMKGSIIGGVMALIVLVASVIGITCFIRYRRRTMIKDIVSDHGSVASFDRRSSGKYSFRMPRPFRLITASEKEYESEHINYNNSMYETQDEPNGMVEKTQLESQRSNTPFTRTLQLDDIDFRFNEQDKNS